jgi:hypothetical protein
LVLLLHLLLLYSIVSDTDTFDKAQAPEWLLNLKYIVFNGSEIAVLCPID